MRPDRALRRARVLVEPALGVDDGGHERRVEVVAARGVRGWRRSCSSGYTVLRVPGRARSAREQRRRPASARATTAGEGGHDQDRDDERGASRGALAGAVPHGRSSPARMLATVCPTNSRSALREPVLWNTKSLRAIFSSSGICCARRRRELAVGELGREAPAAHVVRRRDEHDVVEALARSRSRTAAGPRRR